MCVGITTYGWLETAGLIFGRDPILLCTKRTTFGVWIETGMKWAESAYHEGIEGLGLRCGSVICVKHRVGFRKGLTWLGWDGVAAM